MPAAARKGDPTTEHPCGGQSNPVSVSGDVFINGLGAARLGDTGESHSFNVPPACAPHVTTIATGSSTVFINGKPAARVGDNYTCGVVITSGSPNVNIG